MSDPSDPVIAGESGGDRLMAMIRMRARERRVPPDDLPTPEQVALVTRALADHTTLMAALAYHRGGPGEPWPESLSLGRFFHALSDQIEVEARQRHD